MEKEYVHLQWDSDFLGCNVARIIRRDIDDGSLTSVLQELKVRNYRMVYWFVSVDDRLAAEAALRCGGVLVDEKVTYVKELTCETVTKGATSYVTVPYPYDEPEPTLISLALKSGEYSRFRRDPSFPTGSFEKLYTHWIRRSVRGETGLPVLVVKESSCIAGMVTLEANETRGMIGLIAVESNSRGQGIGRPLVAGAERCFIEHGYTVGKVVTQYANRAACKLYELCGYRIDSIVNVFHFWL